MDGHKEVLHLEKFADVSHLWVDFIATDHVGNGDS